MPRLVCSHSLLEVLDIVELLVWTHNEVAWPVSSLTIIGAVGRQRMSTATEAQKVGEESQAPLAFSLGMA